MFRQLKKAVPSSLRPGALIREHVSHRTEGKVQSGPFEGMLFGKRSVFGAHTPKLLGSYEKELHPWLELITQLEFERIIDIGCAEGYYAVGFARCLPEVQVEAYELQERAHPLIAEQAERNGVRERISIRGGCDTEVLSETLSEASSTLIFCDVEGYEKILLDPQKIPSLYDTHMLVEVHDHKVAGTSKALQERFASTHRICHIPQQTRTLQDLPTPDFLLERIPLLAHRYALNEYRAPATYWMWFEPKNA